MLRKARFPKCHNPNEPHLNSLIDNGKVNSSKQLIRHRPSQPDQLSRDRWRLELRYRQRQGSGLGSSRRAFLAMPKGERIRLKLLKESGSTTAILSRVRGWDSSRILLRNYRHHRVFAKARGTVKSASRGPRSPITRPRAPTPGPARGRSQGGRQLRSKTEGRLQTNDAVRRLRIVRTTGQCV